MNKLLLDYFNGDELAANVWEQKYAKRDSDGNVIENTPDDMHHRLAKEFARVEEKFYNNPVWKKKSKWYKKYKPEFSAYYNKRLPLTEDLIYNLFKNFRWIVPAGSVMSGLGSEKPVSLSNCFVLPSPEDSYTSIMMTRLNQVTLMKRRGGVGYDLSNLRPRGAKVNNAAVTSTGAASFMDVCSDVTNEVAQQGRRGALMLSLSSNCIDIEEFIEKKQDLTKVTGANVSVQVTDEFMHAVENDDDYILRWPVDVDINKKLTEESNNIEWESYEYGVLYPMVYGKDAASAQKGYMKKVKAKELWNKIIHCAWNTAEPGIIFRDTMINYAPDGIYPKYKFVATNPCVTGDGDVVIKTKSLQTEYGHVSVQDLYDMWQSKTGDPIRILSYDIETGAAEYQEVLNVQITKQVKEVLEIFAGDKLKHMTVKVTPEHKMYTANRGYAEASTLTTDDVLLHYEPEVGEYVEYHIEKVEKVEFEEDIPVYDITVENNHNYFVNGWLSKNCGEIGMSGNESCRLLSINLLSFVGNAFKAGESYIDFDLLYEYTYEAMRLGDDLVELENEAVKRIIDTVKNDETELKIWEGILEKSEHGRRVGLGFTALSDMIAALNMKFCTDESNAVVENVMITMNKAVLDAQADMAIERGSFPDQSLGIEAVDGNDWYDHIERDFPEQYRRIITYGRRNISFTTIAPNGSLSLMTRTSSGIEPVFMAYYTRRKKCVNPEDRVDYVDKLGVKFSEFVVVHPTLKKWAEINYPKMDFENLKEKDWETLYKNSPWYGSLAQDIDWINRVEVQGICQRNLISHSISATINLPNNVTEEKVSEIYFEAWKRGLKGITMYRDGCREGILVKKEEKKEEDKFMNNIDAPKRPKTLDADFYTTTVKGEKFFVIVGLYENKPYEVFVYKVKEGEKSDYKQHRGTITKIKRGYYTYKSQEVTIENISSDLTSEEYALALMSSMLMRHGANIKFICKTVEKIDDNISSFSSAMRRILMKYIKEQVIEGEKCPDCGGNLVREDGCIHCIDCGWSKCG